jgi:hypothetical protein
LKDVLIFIFDIHYHNFPTSRIVLPIKLHEKKLKASLFPLYLLKEARENPEGSDYKYITSMITTAFFLEAYLNYLGQKKVNQEDWSKWERQPSYKKLKDLTDKLDYKIDDSKRPFKTFREMFDFRNLMAHAKPQYLSIDKFKEVEKGLSISSQISEDEWQGEKPNWKAIANKDNAQIFFDDAIQIMEILHNQAGLNKAYLFLSEWTEITGM